ncbi:MAG: hypothetical protein QM778_38050 [Myxococcales bacterium]
MFSPGDEDGILWIAGPMVPVISATTDQPPVYSLGNPLNDDAYDIDVDSQNRLVLSTRSKAIGERKDFDRYITRLERDGALDADFGTSGTVAINAPGDRSENARRNDILPNDEIVSAGYQQIDGKANMIIARLDAQGHFVPGFAIGGLLVFNPFQTNDPSTTGACEAYGAARQSNGSFVTIGYGEHSDGDPADSIFSLRISGTGEPDSDWSNGQGYFQLDKLSNAENAATGAENGRNVIVLHDDRVVYVGQGAVGVAADKKKSAVIGMLTKDGVADTTFNTVGHKAYDFNQTNDNFLGLAESADGKYVVAAGASAGSTAANDNAALVIFSLQEQ